MWFLYGLTVLAGVANAIQPGQNAMLSKSLGQPVTAALVILLVSTAALLVGGLAIGKLEMPTGQHMAQVPWWAWLGGIFSVLLILAQLYASPAIGAASFLGHRDGGHSHLDPGRQLRMGRLSGASGKPLAIPRRRADVRGGGARRPVLSSPDFPGPRRACPVALRR
jgi:hypothetical protein